MRLSSVSSIRRHRRPARSRPQGRAVAAGPRGDALRRDAPSLVSTIRESHAKGDAEALWRAAHSLKSSAGALGGEAALARRGGDRTRRPHIRGRGGNRPRRRHREGTEDGDKGLAGVDRRRSRARLTTIVSVGGRCYSDLHGLESASSEALRGETCRATCNC